MKRIALVSCVSKKTEEANKASELYQSVWFKKCKKFVEKEYSNWYILSAKYGLIHNSEVIEPYNKTLSQMTITERKLWGNNVVNKLMMLHPENNILVDIYAGNLYRKYIIQKMTDNGINYTIPLIGLGIGEQLSELERLCK